MLALRVGAFAAVVLAGTLPARAFDHAALARQALERHIRPSYEQVARSAEGLKASVSGLCDKPDPAALKDAQKAFGEMVEAFGHVEHIRFGPAVEAHRYDRLFYWPDRKELGLRQVLAALDTKPADVLDPEKLMGKSVALQGLPALDVLLYGAGEEDLGATSEDGRFRCAFAKAVSENVRAIAAEIESGWARDGAWSKAFMDPGPSSQFYRSPNEITLELFKSFTAGLEYTRDAKLLRPLGEPPDQAKPRLLPFPKSGLGFASAAANVEGLRSLFIDGGFAQIVGEQSAGLDKSAEFDLDYAIKVLRSFDGPPEKILADDGARGQVKALTITLKSLQSSIGGAIAKAAQLAFGFNATDGD